MFQSLTLFQTAHAAARHAGARQALAARNMANSDTPGYVAQDLPAFSALVGSPSEMRSPRQTRPGHLGGGSATLSTEPRAVGTAKDPNGNAVSIEDEMLRSVDAQRQHDRALAVYRAGLSLLRTSLGRG